jgi:hypothetical protein
MNNIEEFLKRLDEKGIPYEHKTADKKEDIQIPFYNLGAMTQRAIIEIAEERSNIE